MKWFLLILLGVCPSLLLSAAPLTTTTEVKGKLANGKTVSVLIPVTPAENDKYASVQRWGSDPLLAAPHYLVGQLSVSVGGQEKKPAVHMSAWVDLSEPRQPKLSVNKSGFKVSFKGGDTLFSYLAIFTFSNEGLLLRRTISDSKGKMVFEDTKYSYDDDVLD